jgi:hypothetical protein
MLSSLIGCQCDKDAEKESALTPFAGTWKFLSLEAISTDGDVFLPYGKEFYGRLMYDDHGNMSFLAMRPDRPKFASGDIYKGTSEEIKAAFLNFDAYCGTYTVDLENKTIVHHVEGCRFPNWEGSRQTRQYELSDGKLTLRANLKLKGKTWSLTAKLIKQ